MKILGFDVETTGLNPDTDRVTEVGAVLFNCEEHAPVRITGYLVKSDIPVSAEITKLTGITQSMIDEDGIASRGALEGVLRQAKSASFFCAHNADFDRGFLQAWCKREGLEMPGIPWIDTRTDLPSAAYARGKSTSLKYLCADHGFLYPAHRAVSDVLAMIQLTSMYDINEVIKRAQTPNISVRAVVSFSEKHLAKEVGFYWVPERKRWEMKLKETELAALKEKASFPIVRMEESCA